MFSLPTFLPRALVLKGLSTIWHLLVIHSFCLCVFKQAKNKMLCQTEQSHTVSPSRQSSGKALPCGLLLQNHRVRAWEVQGALQLPAAVPTPPLRRPGDHPVPRAPLQAAVAAHEAGVTLHPQHRAADGLPGPDQVWAPGLLRGGEWAACPRGGHGGWHSGPLRCAFYYSLCPKSPGQE